MEGENFWAGLVRHIGQYNELRSALESDMTTKNVKQFLEQNPFASASRAELDKITELVDLRLSSMKNKRKRARPELDDELLEKITDKELHKEIFLKLIHAGEDEIDHICKVYLPEAQNNLNLK
jgi:DNA-binding transcriptional MerR regulator